MTEIEAHKFIERCRRQMYPWHAKTEAQAALGMQKFSMGFTMGMFGAMAAEIDSQMQHPDFFKGLVMGVFILSLFCFFFWLTSKLLRARQILGCSQFPNQKS